MPGEYEDNPTPHQQELLVRLNNQDAKLSDLVAAFPDPSMAYICSPIPLSMRQLSRLYRDQWPEEERHRVPTRLRERSNDERWIERRSIFQAKRVAVKKDAILNAEAQVWAMLGIEFHSNRIRSLWERWESLSSYVQDGLERCEAGEAQFTAALRDACRALDETEKQLSEIMPTLGIPERAQQHWTGNSGSREEIIGRIEERLATVAGGGTANTTFELIDGGRGDGSV